MKHQQARRAHQGARQAASRPDNADRPRLHRFLSALAEDERQRILARCNAGRRVAKAKGTRFGRKPKLTDHQQAEALKRLAAGESCRSIAKTMAVHYATVARLAG
jgi:DNA invertase Pin-like site-specific DNA recombinase